MWQKELKQLKKSLPPEEPKQIVKTTIPKPVVESTLNFSDYCADLQIKPLKQDALVHNHKPKNPKVINNSYTSSTTIEQSFEFMDINDAPKEFFRFGQRLLPKQLRDIKTQINRTIDTHNLTRTHALNLIESIIENADTSSIIRIIHGIGNHSEFNQPVLLGTIRKYLTQSNRVLGFSYGSIEQGGNGVTIVKLAK